MQRVITSQLLPVQQPNHFADAEKMHDELDVQDTGKSGGLVSISMFDWSCAGNEEGPSLMSVGSILRHNVPGG
jgi:hypothetical protein